jgi:hypothetical protein
MPLRDLDDLIYMYHKGGSNGVKHFLFRRAIQEIDERTNDLPQETREMLKKIAGSRFGSTPVL